MWLIAEQIVLAGSTPSHRLNSVGQVQPDAFHNGLEPWVNRVKIFQNSASSWPTFSTAIESIPIKRYSVATQSLVAMKFTECFDFQRFLYWETQFKVGTRSEYVSQSWIVTTERMEIELEEAINK